MILNFLWDFVDDQGSFVGFEWKKWVESICYREVHGREAQGCASSATTTTNAVKKPNAAEKAMKKVTKKVGPKKTKKSTPAKPKQPKLIKSPTTKRAKRTIAWVCRN